MEGSSIYRGLDFARAQLPAALSARPGKGEVKGFQAVYDPDLDKTLKGKEKRSRQVQFSPFGEEVCLIAMCTFTCLFQALGKLMEFLCRKMGLPQQTPD